MAAYTGARVVRSFTQPAPAMRKALNKSLAISPPSKLTDTEYHVAPTLRASVRPAPAQILRQGIPGEAYAYSLPISYLRGAQSDGYQVWRAQNAANRIQSVIPPGQKVTPVPPAGLVSGGNPSSPMTGSIGINISGSTLLVIAAALLLWKRL